MGIYESLENLKRIAKEDPAVRSALLNTANAPHPIDEFCRICSELGYPISAMDLVTAGEEDYAAMKRSTNGGGENSPMLEGADDYYGMFLAEI
ncbi:MAG: Nif11-like leader peptide family natural product precursor [Lachnospiraceae bacterium]|nr:Nif11-like leader peptide family natural product precursor [Lachnospiraceae bacterium]